MRGEKVACGVCGRCVSALQIIFETVLVAEVGLRGSVASRDSSKTVNPRGLSQTVLGQEYLIVQNTIRDTTNTVFVYVYADDWI